MAPNPAPSTWAQAKHVRRDLELLVEAAAREGDAYLERQARRGLEIALRLEALTEGRYADVAPPGCNRAPGGVQ